MKKNTGEMVELFLKNFNYLDDDTNKRSIAWYEVWYQGKLKAYMTNIELTKKLEEIARALKLNLSTFKNKHAGQAFDETMQNKFQTIINQAIDNSQVARFKHGQTSEWTADATASVTWRGVDWVPKKVNQFERNIIMGYESLTNQENGNSIISWAKNSIKSLQKLFKKNNKAVSLYRTENNEEPHTKMYDFFTKNLRNPTQYAEKNLEKCAEPPINLSCE